MELDPWLPWQSQDTAQVALSCRSGCGHRSRCGTCAGGDGVRRRSLTLAGHSHWLTSSSAKGPPWKGAWLNLRQERHHDVIDIYNKGAGE